MMKTRTLGLACLAVFLLVLVVSMPVSAVTVGSSSSGATTVLPSPAAAKAEINATISSSTPTLGDSITLSGSETGSTTSAGVQVWVFAGNYVNVSTIPAKADGSFSRTFDSTGYPPAKYYVFLQSPGPDGKFNIILETSGVYSGQVINRATGARIFNFTGAGSVQDEAAAHELSDAINSQGIDDVYTKLTFQLMAPVPVTTAVAAPSAMPAATSVPPTKSPVPVETTGIALSLAAMGFIILNRK